MKYGVTIPIAGHSYVEIEADNKEQAKEKAMECSEHGDVSWECLDCFCEGNVLNCPSPNEIEIELLPED